MENYEPFECTDIQFALLIQRIHRIIDLAMHFMPFRHVQVAFHADLNRE